VEEPSKEARSDQQEARTCPVCGTKFSAAGDSDFCPVCILQGLLAGNLRRPGKRAQYLGQLQPALRRLTVYLRFADLSTTK
jgi:hypothetical protein